MKLGILALLILFITLPLMQVQAQGRDDLSEEEQVLLDRVLAAIEGREAYENYHLSSEEVETLDFEITVFGQTVAFSEQKSVTSESLTIVDGETENVSATIQVVYEESEPDETSRYTIAADVVFLDDILYVDAELVESTSDSGTIEEGWQVYEGIDEIPEVLEELDLDDFFDDEEISPLERVELIESTVAAVSSEPDEIDGVPVENITLEFGSDGMTELFESFMDAEDEENPFLEIMLENLADGELTFVASLDENDQLVAVMMQMSMSFEDILLDDYEIEDIPEGTTLSLTAEIVQSDVASNINADVEPIEAPVE